MKPISEMTRLELAGFVSSAFQKSGVNVVLSGGSCVSIYSEKQYVSMDLDFVNAAFTKRDILRDVMELLGFTEQNQNSLVLPSVYLTSKSVSQEKTICFNVCGLDLMNLKIFLTVNSL